jgi:hypothetical protein
METEIMHAGKSVVEAGVLEDQPDGMAHLVLLVDDVVTVEGGFAGCGAGEGAEYIDGGGLSGAVGAQKTEYFPRRYVEADVVDRDEWAIFFYEIVDMDDNV